MSLRSTFNLPGLNSSQAAIPPGIKGSPTVQQFVPTAGTSNQCNFYRNYAFVPLTHREGLMASAHYQITESMDVFAETLFSHEQLQAAQGLLIDASGATWRTKSIQPFRGGCGRQLQLPWHSTKPRRIRNVLSAPNRSPWVSVLGLAYEVTAYLSHDSFELNLLNATNALQAAPTSADPATALNPFAAVPGSPQLLQSLVAASAPRLRARPTRSSTDRVCFADHYFVCQQVRYRR